MGGPPCARLFPILIAGTAMKWHRVQLRPHRCQELGLGFISWKGTLTITTMLLTPLLSSSCFFFCLFFKICILPLQSHLGFFREINLCLSVTRQNYFFSVCCLSTVKHFTSTCFYQQQWQKKPQPNNKGRKKWDKKVPHANVRGSLLNQQRDDHAEVVRD